MKPLVTMISSLPPIIGLSPYTKGLVSELTHKIPVTFLGFSHIYPAFLYPGKISDPTSILLKENENLSIRNVLNWFNPFGWIIEAFKIKTPIVHAQWWSYPLAFVYITILGIARLRGKKIILTIHNIKPHERNLFKELLNKSVFQLGHVFIVHTSQNKEALGKIIKNKEIHVIPHGLIELPKKGILKNEARAKLGIKENDKVLLCFGHIREYKGLDIALKALSLIKDTQYKLLIAGNCWEKWEKYEQIIKENTLEDRIILKLGYIETVMTEVIFQASDLALLPYKKFDAQSGVGSLFLSYELPMIVSKTGGLPNYVSNTHCLIEPNNEQELAEKIKTILGDANLYAELIKDAEIIKGDLSWPKIANKTIQVYECLIHKVIKTRALN